MILETTNLSQSRHNAGNWKKDSQRTIGHIMMSKVEVEFLIGLEENSQREKMEHRNR
jgi:selenophosphate synthase